MIWSLVTNEEMIGFGTTPVFKFYREAIGANNIELAVVHEKDSLDFVSNSDVVILRSANKNLIDTIRRKRITSTAEDFLSYEFIKDKAVLGKFLNRNDVKIPFQYSIDEVTDGKVYFVKPRYGSDSKGISNANICRSKKEVETQVDRISKELLQESVIEDFIIGIDCTVSCAYNSLYDSFVASAIEIETDGRDNVQTRECKVGYQELCKPMSERESQKLIEIAKRIFSLVGLKHHARIDFRKNCYGQYFAIDVNAMPGLGPLDHFAKSMLLTRNLSYRDTLKMVIDSASI